MARPQELPERFGTEHPSPVGPHPLDSLISPERARLYRQVLARRTAQLAVVIEDCYDPHNATAVARTCDAFGINRLHVITVEHDFRINPKVSQGAHRHVDMRSHEQIEEAYASLREDGYRILVSDLAQGEALRPRDLEREAGTTKLALVFGSEAEGVSQGAIDGADGFFLIPMSGFTRSLNVSVSVAVTLYAIREAALNEDLPGNLPAEDQQRLYGHWIQQHNDRAASALARRIVELDP